MRMTPLDVQSHRFRRRVSGLDPDEVKSFLAMVAEDYESLLRENESQRDRIHRLETQVAELSANEALLKETLVSAQAMSEDLRRSAVKESEVLLGEAEVRAEKILDAAHRRAAALSEDIREMRALRSRLAGALRAAIETHLSLVEAIEADPEEADPLLAGKVTFLSRPAAEAKADPPRAEVNATT